jgi:DNA-binding transcriptional ArsR family regulator
MGATERRRGVIDRRLAKAIAHPLRVEIMVEVERAPMSPREFVARRGGTMSNVAYHFRELAGCGCLELVAERPRGGSVEHVYDVARRPLLSDEDFGGMPAPVRGGLNGSVLAVFVQRAVEALRTGTLEARDWHLTWTPVRLDQKGFARVMAMLARIQDLLASEEEEAAERMAKSGEEPIHSTVGLFGFESPAPERDHGLAPRRR